MKALLRRLTFFPLMLIASPLLYFIWWCYTDYTESIDAIKELLHDTWYGMEV